MSNYAKYMSRGLEILEQSKKEGRDLTPDEYAKSREWFDRAQADRDTDAMVKGLPGSGHDVTFVDGTGPSTGRLGDFVASKEYARIKDGSSRGQNWVEWPCRDWACDQGHRA